MIPDPTVSFTPAYARQGQPGSSMQNPRVSTLSPGRYTGQCLACGAYIEADKRAYRCDDCEVRRRAAVIEYDSQAAPSPPPPFEFTGHERGIIEGELLKIGRTALVTQKNSDADKVNEALRVCIRRIEALVGARITA